MIAQSVDRAACRGLIEFELRRPPRMVRAGVYGIACVLLGAGVAAYLIRVPEVVTAKGQVRPAQGTVFVDAERAGRVVVLAAREGDSVQQGQTLLELEVGTLREELRIEEDRMQRVSTQIDELDRILNGMEGDLSGLRMYRDRFANIRSELAVNRARAEAAEREWKAYESLESISRIEREKKRDEARVALLTLQQALQAHRSALEAERRQAEVQELEIRGRRLALERELERCRIAAPVAGRITFGAIREIGSFVQLGQRFFVIEPAGSGWIFEGWLPGGRSGRAQEGIQTKVNLAAYPVLDYGTIPGVVEKIAPDTQEGARRVRIRLLADEVRGRAGRGAIAVGMEGEARIVVRERRLLFHILGDWADAVR